MAEVLGIVACALLVVAIALLLLLMNRQGRVSSATGEDVERASEHLERGVREESARSRAEGATSAKDLRDELGRRLDGSTQSLVGSVGAVAQAQRDELAKFSQRLVDFGASTDGRLDSLRRAMDERLTDLQVKTTQALDLVRKDSGESAKTHRDELSGRLTELSKATEAKLEAVRGSVEAKLGQIQTENAAKLEEMRKTVDEKLSSTLDLRLGASFKLVSERLEQVHKGLGEMQTLASGVGDLKRVLTNVKTRGTWGEVQLGTLLEQILTPEQYEQNVETRPGSGERVEFAIKLPGREDVEGKVVWLPIDAKFPVEDYERLIQASERGDGAGVEEAARGLEAQVRQEARTIQEKYVSPPDTTDFALLFLPSEGLYAEVLRRPGLVDKLQREHRVVITGPTTLAALLNSLQMGFRTLAIQKRSSEVWQVLGAVKTEFGKFGETIEKVKKKLEEASKVVDSVSVRSRQITRKLRTVEELPSPRAIELLGAADGVPEEESAAADVEEE